ncbi:MAG: isoaspartyl peptidase/L-asparaginase [Alphaproteobacteria bacterium]|nr:isoaspartyl peptidase/L-asparaginase [Alphaproteobacteria bacterium]MBP7758246.1 isoaspartyl peptidase/L-asparaginase [Alphaproteobacteria bacterium]MBP7761611.1 isoaspartyl peptidase/L-asparaginase [Alphaproteobacteria bacterium]MBP7904037.1 isoaspartyl peptidase/L-asparaginase [Alphaproteobacteria bacterium]
MSDNFVLAVHGGAFMNPRDYSQQTNFIENCLKSGWRDLKGGQSALEAVVQAVVKMEDSALFIAGKGAGPNSEGDYELDASLMEGESGKAGAIAAVRGIKNPIIAARTVMEKTPHVLLAGLGAERFLSEQGLEQVKDPAHYFTPSHTENQVIPPTALSSSHGTVGAVALDRDGNLAAATSTGGLVGKRAGRVGDSPIIGAATWADRNLAVSTTGYGEYFMRAVAAYDVLARCLYGGKALEVSVSDVLDGIRDAGGWGGLIALNRKGEVCLDYRCAGMHRGFVRHDGAIHARSLPDI